MTGVCVRVLLPVAIALAAAASIVGTDVCAQSATLPEIRMTQKNVVPRCVTPERLMAFLRQRTPRLDPRFRDIAHHYKRHGEAWRVRWDYAFFQMAIETNFLSYRRPNGRMGDVDPRQNNFAGIGTTGGGVPGDSFPDVSTGVLGQIQHLVVYSGEQVAQPVAPRTQLKQQHILAKSWELNRPVRFSDLARRWAVDPKYASSIEWVAQRYRDEYCRGDGRAQEVEVLPWQQTPQRRGDAEGVGGGATPAKTKMAEARLASPVKTIWSGDDKAVKEASREEPPPPPVRPVADSERIVAPAPVAAAEEAAAFAFYAPPAGLSAAKIAPVADPLTAAVAGPVIAPAAPADPKVVSGTSVGGFMIAGAGSKPEFDPPSGLGVKPGRCVVEAASYGGETTVLVKSPEGADVRYVALSVLDGFEESMTQSFLASRPAGGETLGTYPSKAAALAQARTLCPE